MPDGGESRISRECKVKNRPRLSCSVSLSLCPCMALRSTSEAIRGALNTPTTSVQHMGVDHRGAHIPVAQQFLDRPNIRAIFQQK